MSTELRRSADDTTQIRQNQQSIQENKILLNIGFDKLSDMEKKIYDEVKILLRYYGSARFMFSLSIVQLTC